MLLAFIFLTPITVHGQEERESLKDMKHNSDRQYKVWVEMTIGQSTFTKESSGCGGLGLNIVKDHHLFGFDWLDHYPVDDSYIIDQCTKAPLLVHYNLYYGYFDYRGDKFWYGKGGFSMVRSGNHTGILTAECENGVFEINLYPGVPVEAGFGLKWHYVAAQIYISGLFYEERAVGAIGLKLSLGAF